MFKTVVLTMAALAGMAGTASASTDYPWPPPEVKPVHKTVKELQAQAEGFSERQRKLVDNATPGEWGGEMPGHFVDGQQYMDNWTTTPQASFFTQVHAPGHFRESPQEVCDGAIGAKKCTGSVLRPDGGLVLFTEDVDWPFRVVYSYRPNGEVVWVQTDQDSALTPEQAARVASDPEFTFTK